MKQMMGKPWENQRIRMTTMDETIDGKINHWKMGNSWNKLMEKNITK